MQNRFPAIIILLIILGICCLGLYVAVSGFLNNNPPSFLANIRGTAPVFTAIPVILPTDTRAPIQTNTPAAIEPTAVLPTAPIISIPTIVLGTPTSAQPAPTSRPNSPTAPPTVSPAAGCGPFQFCNVGGPPDPSIMQSASGCPSNYIWGRVIDLAGKGLPSKRIRFRDPQNIVGNPVITKDVPDVPGKYDIPTTGPPGSSWVVWVQADDGTPASPQVTITTQNYGGAGNCPNRIDFKQQR